MGGPSAIDAAFGLAQMPALAGRLRTRPLPRDMLVVLQVAAGIEPVVEEIAVRFTCSRRDACTIARLYLQQVVLFAGADSHRLLGVEPGAGWEEINRNKRLLSLWLHPDINRNGWESALILRVLAAWEDLRLRHPAAGACPARRPGRREKRAWEHPVRWIRHQVTETAAVRTRYSLTRAGALRLALGLAGGLLLLALLSFCLWSAGTSRAAAVRVEGRDVGSLMPGT